jgi:DNA-binding transcriptional LysR family regulator
VPAEVELDIRALRYAVSLSEELHFGRAAERNFIAAQPFGRRIQALERELGQTLFDRTSRRVAVTVAGERFVSRARQVLADLDTLSRQTGDVPTRTDQHLILGVFGFGMGALTSLVLDTFREMCPRASVAFAELDYANHYDAIRRGDVDVGAVQYTGSVDGLVFDRLFSSPRVVVVPARSQWADAELLTERDLGTCAWLEVEPSSVTLSAWIPASRSSLGGSGVRTPSAIPTAVASTGLLSLHAALAEVYFPRPDVRFVPCEGAPCEIAIATRAGDTRPLIAAFRRSALTIAQATYGAM